MANFEIISLHTDSERIVVDTVFECIVDLKSDQDYETQIFGHLEALYLIDPKENDIKLDGNAQEGFLVIVDGENSFNVNPLN